MDDIVEKLREYYENWSLGSKGPAILAQAADLIESLRSDNARLAKELEEARKAGMEEAAKVADDAADGRRWQKSDASAHNDMRAARDFETMMMEAIQIAAAIRHKATVTTDNLPEGGRDAE